MRSLLAVWLITLLSLTPPDLSAVGQPLHLIQAASCHSPEKTHLYLHQVQVSGRCEGAVGRVGLNALLGPYRDYATDTCPGRTPVLHLSLTGRCQGADGARECRGESPTLRVQVLRRYASQYDNDGKQITIEEYWELVRNTRQAILQMEAKPEEAIREQLNALASQWDQVTAVELSDNSVMQIDSAYLAAELRRDTSDLKRLEKLLDALLHAHETYPQKVFTLEDIDTLKGILARPEFQWDQGQAVEMPNWLGNLFERFFNFLDRFLLRTGTLVYQGRILLMIAAALLFVFSVFYVSRNLSRSLVREAQLATEGSENDELLSSKGAFKRAEVLSTQGDYRNAIRYLYLSSLLVLDEQGLLRYDRSRTNREYLRSISSRPELANRLHDVIEVFDRVWYGFESVDEQTYRSYVEHVEELREKKE